MRPGDDRARSIAIVGAVGIPASYGGFETLAENLATFHKERQIPLPPRGVLFGTHGQGALAAVRAC